MSRIDSVIALAESVKTSLERYEASTAANGHPPFAGYEVARVDGKESIRRRITVIRDELLQISKSL